jgi:glycosyltransferase involved in cell wall biosynthesis
MKICLVTAFPPSRDALNEYGFHIASELCRIPGISLTVLGDQHTFEGPELDGFEVIRCWKFNSMGNPWNVLRAIWQQRPDVVWFNLGFASFGGKPLPAFSGIAIPCLARLTGSYTHVTLHQLMETVDLKDAGIRFPLAYKVGGFIATQIVLFANSVSVMLPAYRNILRAKYGRGSVYVRRHGIFSSRPEYPEFTKRGDPEHRILAFGKWGTYKRLEPLLEAFDAIAQRVPNARLIVAGTDHPKTPGYLKSVQTKYAAQSKISFIGYVAEEQIGELLQTSTVAVLPYTSSAGSSGIAHLACTYGVPIVASDIPDFRRLADEEGLAIDFFPAGDVRALGQHLVDLLLNRERQVEMSLQNVSAAMRMSMPEIVREYLRTFELRQELSTMRSLSAARRLPAWLPLRNTFLRHKARKMMRAEAGRMPETAVPDVEAPVRAEVVYIANSADRSAESKTGTDF